MNFRQENNIKAIERKNLSGLKEVFTKIMHLILFTKTNFRKILTFLSPWIFLPNGIKTPWGYYPRFSLGPLSFSPIKCCILKCLLKLSSGRKAEKCCFWIVLHNSPIEDECQTTTANWFWRCSANRLTKTRSTISQQSPCEFKVNLRLLWVRINQDNPVLKPQ